MRWSKVAVVVRIVDYTFGPEFSPKGDLTRIIQESVAKNFGCVHAGGSLVRGDISVIVVYPEIPVTKSDVASINMVEIYCCECIGTNEDRKDCITTELESSIPSRGARFSVEVQPIIKL